MAQHTTNYNLFKPELTDAADITKMNENWDIVDNELNTKQSKTMVVTITGDATNGYTADKTFDEIKAYIDAGGEVIAKRVNAIHQLITYSIVNVKFTQANAPQTCVINIDRSDRVTVGIITSVEPSALDDYLPLTGGTLTGVVNAPTPPVDTKTTQIATTEFVHNVVDTMSHFEIGDIKTTVKTDLGDNWLLCNGASITKTDYPELCKTNGLRHAILTNQDPTLTGDDNGIYSVSDIIYANGKWAMVGQSNYYGRVAVADKPEGPWKVANFGYSDYPNSICYSNGVWVRGARQWNEEDACVKVATDPLGSWTIKRISDIANGSVGKFATNGSGVFCAVASTGNTSSSTNHRVVYSMDNGNSWSSLQPVTSSFSIAWKDIAYGDGLWVIIGQKDEYISSKFYYAPIMAYATSPAGPWTLVELDSYPTGSQDTCKCSHILYANGKWVITGMSRFKQTTDDYDYLYYFNTYTFTKSTANSPVKHSIDLGVHYTYGTNDVTAFLSYHSLLYCNNKYMAVGGKVIAETTDPSGDWTFTPVTIRNGNDNYYIGSGGATDGSTWIAPIDWASRYVTNENYLLPTLTHDNSYTYIKVKENDDGNS